MPNVNLFVFIINASFSTLKLLCKKKYVKGNQEDFTASSGPFIFLSEGQKYDLCNRKVIKPARTVKTDDDF